MFSSFGMRCILSIFLVGCFFQGALAIEVSFSAEDGGGSVGISDDYEVSTGVSVSEESEANFGNVEMTNCREVAGSGDVSMTQTYSGSGGYVGNSYVSTQDASSTISTSAILTPAALNAKLSGSIIGRSSDLSLNLNSNGYSAQTNAGMNGGLLSTDMAAWTGSASVSQITDMNAEEGSASSIATGLWNDGYLAIADLNMKNGNLKTNQIASFDGNSAIASQTSEVNAEQGSTSSFAWSFDGYKARSFLNMKNGNLKTNQIARHDGSSAVASQTSEVNAEQGSASSSAYNWDDRHQASTSLNMKNGNLKTNQIAGQDGSGTTASQISEVNAEEGSTSSSAYNLDDENYANTFLNMKSGNLKTNQIARNDGSGATISQISEANADESQAWSSAGRASTSLNMKNGNLKTNQIATHDGSSAVASQISEANADESYAGSYVGSFFDGYKARTYLIMKNGNLKTNQIARQDDSSSHASGEFHVMADMINLAESATQGSDHSSITTTVNSVGNVKGTFDGMVTSYADYSTGASQSGRIVGGYQVRGVANDLTKYRYSASGTFDRIVNAWTDDTGQYINGLSGDWFINPGQLIQPVIDSAEAGDTIELASGIFNENLIINKLLTLLGAGSGDDTSFNTLINAVDKSKSVISIVTGGTSNDNRLIVKDLQVTGATSSSGISINGVGDISHITLDNIASTGNYYGADFSALGSDNRISDVVVSNSQVTNSGMDGVNIDARNHGNIGNVDIIDSTISGSGGNGVRVNAGVRYSSDSRVSGTIGNVDIEGCTLSNSGSSGVDVRAYSGSTIGSVGIAGSVISGAGESGVYGGAYYGGTTVGNIGITESTISGCDRGLSMGATGGGINNNIVLTDSTISNSLYDGIWTAAANGGTVGKLGITRSTITGSGWNGVSTKTWAGGSIGKLEAHESNIYGNNEFGIMNQAGTTFDATNSWWGNGGAGVNVGKPGEEGNNPAGSVLYTSSEAWRRSYGQTTSQTLGVVTYTPWSTSKFPEVP